MNDHASAVVPASRPRSRRIGRSRRSAADPGNEAFQILVESAPDAIVVVDRAGRMLFVNRQTEQLFGYRREDLLDRHVEILVTERFRRAYATHCDACVETPSTVTTDPILELAGCRSNGAEFPAEIVSRVVRTETAPGALILSVIRDISARKAVEGRLEEASRLKSEFLANMSHELRTPLNAIIGFASFLHKGNAGALTDEQREYLGDVVSSSKHLLRLINDVLDLAKIEAGMMEFRPEPIDLANLVGDVRHALRGLAGGKNLSVDVSVHPDAVSVHADPDRVRQILYNYLSNAIKFTPDSGSVSIRVVPEGAGFFKCEVEDTGAGIADDDLPRLFNDFQQLDAGLAKRQAGTGLGLALTKRLADAQGGRVEVRSTPGRGSTFAVVLPRRMPATGDCGNPNDNPAAAAQQEKGD